MDKKPKVLTYYLFPSPNTAGDIGNPCYLFFISQTLLRSSSSLVRLRPQRAEAQAKKPWPIVKFEIFVFFLVKTNKIQLSNSKKCS